MSGIEKQWIWQGKHVALFDEQREWNLALEYIKKHGIKKGKISRKNLKKLLSEDPVLATKLQITTEDINHSFFLLPTGLKEFDLVTLARSKPYDYKGRSVHEGVKGSGTEGRVNPGRLRTYKQHENNEIKPLDDSSGIIVAVKAVVTDAPTHPFKYDVEILPLLGAKLVDTLSRENENKEKPWVYDQKGRYTHYMFSDYHEGEIIGKLKLSGLTGVELLRIAIAMAKEINKLHKIGYVHKDLNLSNLMKTEEGSSFRVNAIDLSKARSGNAEEIAAEERKFIDVMLKGDLGIVIQQDDIEAHQKALSSFKYSTLDTAIKLLEENLKVEEELAANMRDFDTEDLQTLPTSTDKEAFIHVRSRTYTTTLDPKDNYNVRPYIKTNADRLPVIVTFFAEVELSLADFKALKEFYTSRNVMTEEEFDVNFVKERLTDGRWKYELQIPAYLIYKRQNIWEIVKRECVAMIKTKMTSAPSPFSF